MKIEKMKETNLNKTQGILKEHGKKLLMAQAKKNEINE